MFGVFHIGRNADGKWLDCSHVIFTIYREMLPFHARFQRAIYCLQKIVAMGLNVKTDQVCGQQSVEKLALPGTDTECLRIRPGNVPEDCNAGVRPLLLDHLRQQSKVVILNKQGRLFRAGHLVQHRFGKLPVHLFIMFPILGSEQRPRMRDMAERPQAFVSEAVVVAFFFIFVEPYAPQRVLRLVGWNSQPVIPINGFAVRVAAAMGDPGPVTGPQNRLQCSDQSAGWNKDLERLAFSGMHVRFTVGDHKQPTAVELAAHVYRKPLRGPCGFACFTQASFFFRRLPGSSQTLH